ncbi:MAG: DNA polymerase I [Planctomycetes bacterium]|nr:DNA polymerase I [Planctomycetota bacterium]
MALGSLSKFFIIDGYSYGYQAYYGIPRLQTPGGTPAGAVFGFAQLIEKVLEEKPDYLAVVFDHPEPTFRHQRFPEYKANRAPMPEELEAQLPAIRELLQAYRIPILEVAGFEADDVIGALARRAAEKGIDAYLVSRDKDLEQLLDEHIRYYDSSNGKPFTVQSLREKKGIAPSQVVDYLSLVGDDIDNIPGIDGIGPKTAVKVLSQVESLDALFGADPDRRRWNLPAGVIDKILKSRPQLEETRGLLKLRTDCPLPLGIEDLKVGEPDAAALRQLFERFHFRNLLKKLEARHAAAPTASPQPPEASELDLEGMDSSAALESEVRTESEAAPAAAPEVSATPLPSHYRLVRSERELESLRDLLRGAKRFAFDTETTGLNPLRDRLVGLSFAVFKEGLARSPAAREAPVQAFYVPLRAPEPLELSQEKILGGLRPVLEDPNLEKVGQNIKFDARFCRSHGLRLRGIAGDSMVASYLLNPGIRGHNLDSLAIEYLRHRNIPIESLIGEEKEAAGMETVPLEKISEYSCEDADVALRLCAVLEEKLELEGLHPVYRDVEVPLIEVLAEMEHRGITIDRAHLDGMARKLNEELEELTRKIHERVGREFNIASPQQLGKVLFEDLGLPRGRRGKIGWSTSAEVLESMKEKHPVVPWILDHRSLTKLLGTYVEALPQLIEPSTGRIHTSFNQTVTATGRLSSSDPNLQNIPVKTELGREIRKAFMPGQPDHVLLSADYSQVELRILAHLSADASLIESFRRGEDIHRAVAALVNGVSQDLVTPEMRRAAKAVNFGIIYGMSPFGLSQDLGIPVEDAADFIGAYFSNYPGVSRFVDATIAGARETGEVRTILGRRRRIPDLNSKNQRLRGFAERTAVNTVVQGSAADLIKVAMNNIYTDLQERQADNHLLLQIHDELIFEVHRDRAEEECGHIRREMAGAIRLAVPVTVDIHWGESWYEA